MPKPSRKSIELLGAAVQILVECQDGKAPSKETLAALRDCVWTCEEEWAAGSWPLLPKPAVRVVDTETSLARTQRHATQMQAAAPETTPKTTSDEELERAVMARREEVRRALLLKAGKS